MFTPVVIKSAVIRLPMINLSPLIFKPKHFSSQVHNNNNTIDINNNNKNNYRNKNHNYNNNNNKEFAGSAECSPSAYCL